MKITINLLSLLHY